MKEYELYLREVRAALWGEDVPWDEAQMERLLRLHALQGTGPLVYTRLLGQSDVSSYARTHMKGMCLSTMQQQVHLQQVLEHAWLALEREGVHAVLMKGVGLAALYEELHMRPWGDIDLFVGVHQYHPACAVMRATFPEALKFDEELDHYKHYNLIADGVSIEIHRVSVGFQHPIDERRYARIEAYGMTHSEPVEVNGLKIRVPNATFNALFVMLHSWEHMITQGASMRQLCDLALLLHRHAADIDRTILQGWLRALHLTDVWHLYMSILVRHMGLPESEAPCYTLSVAERADRLLADLLDGKMVEPRDRSAAPKGRFARKWHTMRGRQKNAKRIAQYSPAYARHMRMTTLLHGALRLFAKDRHWE